MRRLASRLFLGLLVLTAGSVGLFLAYPSLLTVALVLGVVGGIGLSALVRLLDRLRDLYGLDDDPRLRGG